MLQVCSRTRAVLAARLERGQLVPPVAPVLVHVREQIRRQVLGPNLALPHQAGAEVGQNAAMVGGAAAVVVLGTVGTRKISKGDPDDFNQAATLLTSTGTSRRSSAGTRCISAV